MPLVWHCEICKKELSIEELEWYGPFGYCKPCEDLFLKGETYD